MRWNWKIDRHFVGLNSTPDMTVYIRLVLLIGNAGKVCHRLRQRIKKRPQVGSPSVQSHPNGPLVPYPPFTTALFNVLSLSF